MFTISEIANFLSCISRGLPYPDDAVSELLFDSRRLLMPAKTLFFAIKTEKNDGHAYIPDLIRKGVRNFVVTENFRQWESYGACNFVRVDDSVAALQKVAERHRRQFDIPVVGITGSNGKTIVKEWLTQMLSEDYKLVVSPNSYNSQIGVPMSVWQMGPQHDLAIFEAGISRPDEMHRLADIIQPTIGILTNIGSAHAQFFKDEQEKLEEKVLLFKDCPVVLYCNNNTLIDNIFKRKDFQDKTKLSWGFREDSAFHITEKKVERNHTLVTMNGKEFDIPFADDASVENALHTVVLLLHLGFTAADINRKLALLTPVSMRMEVKEALNQSVVINDTYSLDINSLRVALDFMNSQIRYERKTVILSDFAQVGTLAREAYSEINDLLTNNHIGKLIAVGSELGRHRDLFTMPGTHFFDSTADLLAHLNGIDFHNEVILVKGARHFEFEKVTDALQLRSHRTILNVSLPALVNNLNYYRSLIAPQTKVVAMVKAMCYGLGDVELISELQYHNIDYLAVAYTDEGVNLRKKNIKLPIIVLGAEGESFEMMISHNLEPEIFNFYSLEEFEKALSHHPEIQEFKIHLKIDTGMHRLGFRKDDLPELVARIQRNPQLKVASVFSHLAAADDEKEDAFTLSQIAYFEEVSNILQNSFDYPILRHIDNTAGISRFPQAHYDMVRLGIGLYGFTSVAADQPHLQHVATLRTVITHVRTIGVGETVGYNRTYSADQPTKVGIIPIGYADGFPPELGRGVGSVLVKGTRVPIIGKVCMDMTMIDLTGTDATEGDEVVVYGEANRIDDIARSIGKIPYHLLTAISKRVPRTYVME